MYVGGMHCVPKTALGIADIMRNDQIPWLTHEQEVSLLKYKNFGENGVCNLLLFWTEAWRWCLAC